MSEKLRELLRKYWGYEDFRPLQAEAMQAVRDGRDSVVVLPTGSGKSLCFQLPALAMPGLAVVVSPLISLMKDQVDALRNCGVPAACVNSTLSYGERRGVADEINAGRLKLLYLSPERLMTPATLEFLSRANVSFFAIDEAHCVSDWGHDFRPEYRQLAALKERFPGVALHAYTATATAQVRDDIASQLQLVDPEVLVGSFDRPNLVYRVMQRKDRLAQICEVIERHRGESGIIYCIRRADVDETCAQLQSSGYRALPYHAGMTDDERHRNQEEFIRSRVEIIVATVAFGMGIDKPDVRYVIHAGAPKSLEGYQQESGRAGRDGLEAECLLLYSSADLLIWRKLTANLEPSAAEPALALLVGIERYCHTVGCRHKALLGYFGQKLAADNCNACDYCLGELDVMDDGLVIGQKILSCVLRLQERFGAAYTVQVLIGSHEERIVEQRHDQLSTFGLLEAYDRRDVRAWIEQLAEQGFVERVGEYSVLQVTPRGRELLRGEIAPQLLKPAERQRKTKSRSASAESGGRGAKPAASWEGVDRELFEHLRAWRRETAAERGVPPYIVFGDATLRDLARQRPSTVDRLLAVHGIGEKKSAEYGAELVAEIARYCERAGSR